MMGIKKFEKVVEWEDDGFGFISNWIFMIFVAIFFPIIYIINRRKVYYKEIKGASG